MIRIIESNLLLKEVRSWSDFLEWADTELHRVKIVELFNIRISTNSLVFRADNPCFSTEVLRRGNGILEIYTKESTCFLRGDMVVNVSVDGNRIIFFLKNKDVFVLTL